LPSTNIPETWKSIELSAKVHMPHSLSTEKNKQHRKVCQRNVSCLACNVFNLLTSVSTLYSDDTLSVICSKSC
jgi:UV DNA damage repair endonuclease